MTTVGSQPGAGAEPGAELARVLAAAQRFYAEQLHQAPEVLAYLDRRGLPPELVGRLGVGYAPDRWTPLLDSLRRVGLDEDSAIAAGLAMPTSRPGVVDRLRHRIVLPVKDETGRLTGFTGRAAPGSSPNVPKYLDALARGVKSRTLHGLADSRRLLANGAVPVLCEGPFDAHAVTRLTRGAYVGLAPGGTHLTPAHLTALATVTPLNGRRVVVAFDNDPAGQRAALASWPLLRAVGAVPDRLTLPAGSDPSELAVTRPSRLQPALNAAPPLEDAVIDARLARWAGRLQWAEGRVGALVDLAPVVVALPADRVARQVGRVAQHLALPAASVTNAIVTALQDSPDVAAVSRPPPGRALHR